MRPDLSKGRSITSKKHPIIAEFRELASLHGRVDRSLFVIEGLLLAQRAVRDALPIDKVLYTPALLEEAEGPPFLGCVRAGSIPHYQISGGIMGAVTTTRPVPCVVASVQAAYPEVEALSLPPEGALLLLDGISNPDNLGLVLRTADAAGIEAVVVMEEEASPFHKNCVRAARGAIGRLPLFECKAPAPFLCRLTDSGYHVLGTSAHAEKELYDLPIERPVAFVVGSENKGVQEAVLGLCTERVRIPMSPGQSSLNVAVATGILLYELVRRGRGDRA